MNLPAQVQQASERADELLKNAAPFGTPPSDQPVEDDPNSETWKHKFDVLQGKYNAEIQPLKDDVNTVNRLKGENKTLRNQVQQLTTAHLEDARLISEIRQKQDAVKEPAQQAVDPNAALTAEDLEYLEEQDLSGKTLSLISKLAQAAAQAATPRAEMAAFQNAIGDVRREVQTVKQDVQTTRAQTFQQRLYEAIPDFDHYVGETAEAPFVEWAAGKDSDWDTLTRMEKLQNLLNAEDIAGLKRGIDAYKATRKGKTRNIDSQVEPGESIVGEAPQRGKTYTMTEIQKFYLDQTKGLYRGKEKLAAQIDADIMAAQKEGRIKK